MRLLAATAGVLLGCRGPGPTGSPLRPDEQALVDVYVRITLIESMRADAPDSVGPALDRLAASYDSTAVRRALAELDADPSRWQMVFDAIAQRLHAMEENPARGAGSRPAPGEPLNAPGPARSPSRPRIP